ncbi:hypothetical protein BJY21_003116 [Kineosphaera limosa]|uniref:cell wall-binding repeat-containing protein n=1 Tax=Kineosphaera limosa TaxID=111564 RepID=UPI0002D52D0E|nr:cell wall-binding repeat-containing protein [Kineosphaera limosa]NYE01932.1 hypothetical protein [Kineosphaera limosa]
MATADVNRPTPVRLSGDTRYDTAAAVVRWRANGEIPAGPKLRLVSGATPLLAVALGGDATPTLFVPPSGPVPASVRAAYQHVNPLTVEVVGGLSDAQVRAVVGAKRVTRVPGDPISLSWRRALNAANQGSDDQISQMPDTLFTPARVLAEAAAAAQLRDAYTVITPQRGPLPPHGDAGTFHYPEPAFWEPVAVVGGASAIPEAQRKALLRGQHELERAEFVDVAGADRYATSALLARRAYPVGARTVYLASGIGGVDAAAALSLTDGPLFLVPPCGPLPATVRDGVRDARPERVVAIGDSGVLCDELLQEAVNSTVARENLKATSMGAGCLIDEAGAVHCIGRAPQRVADQPEPATAVATGLGWAMCIITRSAQLSCSRATGQGDRTEFTTVAGPPSGVAEYAALSGDAACARGTDGSIWCHHRIDHGPPDYSYDPTPLTPVAGLPKARALVARNMAACILGTDRSVWCWGDNTPAVVGQPVVPRPTRIDLGAGFVPESIAIRDWLLVRSTEGVVRAYKYPNAPVAGAAPRLPLRARALLSNTNCYFAEPDARLICPLDSDTNRNLVDIKYGDRAADISDNYSGAKSCVVRADGSVACRSMWEGGLVTELGDGLMAPRYREAEVLGFSRSRP